MTFQYRPGGTQGRLGSSRPAFGHDISLSNKNLDYSDSGVYNSSRPTEYEKAVDRSEYWFNKYLEEKDKRNKNTAKINLTNNHNEELEWRASGYNRYQKIKEEMTRNQKNHLHYSRPSQIHGHCGFINDNDTTIQMNPNETVTWEHQDPSINPTVININVNTEDHMTKAHGKNSVQNHEQESCFVEELFKTMFNLSKEGAIDMFADKSKKILVLELKDILAFPFDKFKNIPNGLLSKPKTSLVSVCTQTRTVLKSLSTQTYNRNLSCGTQTSLELKNQLTQTRSELKVGSTQTLHNGVNFAVQTVNEVKCLGTQTETLIKNNLEKKVSLDFSTQTQIFQVSTSTQCFSKQKNAETQYENSSGMKALENNQDLSLMSSGTQTAHVEFVEMQSKYVKKNVETQCSLANESVSTKVIPIVENASTQTQLLQNSVGTFASPNVLNSETQCNISIESIGTQTSLHTSTVETQVERNMLTLPVSNIDTQTVSNSSTIATQCRMPGNDFGVQVAPEQKNTVVQTQMDISNFDVPKASKEIQVYIPTVYPVDKKSIAIQSVISGTDIGIQVVPDVNKETSDLNTRENHIKPKISTITESEQSLSPNPQKLGITTEDFCRNTREPPTLILLCKKTNPLLLADEKINKAKMDLLKHTLIHSVIDGERLRDTSSITIDKAVSSRLAEYNSKNICSESEVSAIVKSEQSSLITNKQEISINDIVSNEERSSFKKESEGMHMASCMNQSEYKTDSKSLHDNETEQGDISLSSIDCSSHLTELSSISTEKVSENIILLEQDIISAKLPNDAYEISLSDSKRNSNDNRTVSESTRSDISDKVIHSISSDLSSHEKDKSCSSYEYGSNKSSSSSGFTRSYTHEKVTHSTSYSQNSFSESTYSSNRSSFSSQTTKSYFSEKNTSDSTEHSSSSQSKPHLDQDSNKSSISSDSNKLSSSEQLIHSKTFSCYSNQNQKAYVSKDNSSKSSTSNRPVLSGEDHTNSVLKCSLGNAKEDIFKIDEQNKLNDRVVEVQSGPLTTNLAKYQEQELLEDKPKQKDNQCFKSSLENKSVANSYRCSNKKAIEDEIIWSQPCITSIKLPEIFDAKYRYIKTELFERYLNDCFKRLTIVNNIYDHLSNTTLPSSNMEILRIYRDRPFEEVQHYQKNQRRAIGFGKSLFSSIFDSEVNYMIQVRNTKAIRAANYVQQNINENVEQSDQGSVNDQSLDDINEHGSLAEPDASEIECEDSTSTKSDLTQCTVDNKKNQFSIPLANYASNEPNKEGKHIMWKEEVVVHVVSPRPEFFNQFHPEPTGHIISDESDDEFNSDPQTCDKCDKKQANNGLSTKTETFLKMNEKETFLRVENQTTKSQGKLKGNNQACHDTYQKKVYNKQMPFKNPTLNNIYFQMEEADDSLSLNAWNKKLGNKADDITKDKVLSQEKVQICKGIPSIRLSEEVPTAYPTLTNDKNKRTSNPLASTSFDSLDEKSLVSSTDSFDLTAWLNKKKNSTCYKVPLSNFDSHSSYKHGKHISWKEDVTVNVISPRPDFFNQFHPEPGDRELSDEDEDEPQKEKPGLLFISTNEHEQNLNKTLQQNNLNAVLVESSSDLISLSSPVAIGSLITANLDQNECEENCLKPKPKRLDPNQTSSKVKSGKKKKKGKSKKDQPNIDDFMTLQAPNKLAPLKRGSSQLPPLKHVPLSMKPLALPSTSTLGKL